MNDSSLLADNAALEHVGQGGQFQRIGLVPDIEVANYRGHSRRAGRVLERGHPVPGADRFNARDGVMAAVTAGLG